MGNTATFNLTTIVIDHLAPIITYTSNYNTSSPTSTNAVVELVEASLTDAYHLGELAAADLPGGDVVNVNSTEHNVNRSQCTAKGGAW